VLADGGDRCEDPLCFLHCPSLRLCVLFPRSWERSAWNPGYPELGIALFPSLCLAMQIFV
jgi:hypothetical protein